MLSLSLVTLGLAIIGAYAKPTVRAVGGLEVSLSTPTNEVRSVSDLRVVATVKNVGDEDLKILKFGTVLDNELPTRSFIVRKDGKEAPFTGVTVSVSMDHLSEHDWVIIPAGKTVTAEHDVSAVYDFSTTGPGTFTFDPVSGFQAIGANNYARAIPDSARTNTVNTRSVSITVTNDVSKRELGFEKRARVDCSNSTKASFISASVVEGRSMALAAAAYIDSHGAGDSLFKAYFESNPTSNVTANFKAVAAENSTSRIMTCESDPGKLCHGSVAAYTGHPSTNIYYCELFYSLRSPGTLCTGNTVNAGNLRGGVTLHELTHALGIAHDIKYGCPEDQKLPGAYKIINADNYNCFAAQVYANTKCGR